MALEEVEFYNIVGEIVSLSTLVGQILDYYQQKREVGETQVTDFNEGSEIRNIIEGIAVLCFNILEDENEAGKLPFISTSYGTYLDRIGENPFINLPRIEGNPSQGNVTFTLSVAQANDVSIPAGTLLATSTDGLEFETTDVCVISAGDTTGTVSAECLTSGYDGNISPGQLTVINDADIDTSLISVNNTEAFYNGAEYEEDEDYRLRLLSNVRAEGFGSVPYYIALGENIDGVHDISFVSASGYSRKVLVNGYEKPTQDKVLLDVLAAFTDNTNLVLNHKFTADTPTYSPSGGLSLTISLNMLSEWSSADLTNFVTKMVYGGSFEQIEFAGLKIGENLTKQFIVDNFALLGDVVEVTSVKITGQSAEFTSTNIGSTAVVKLNTLTFSQTVVTD